MKDPRRFYVLYDERAAGGDTSDAIVLVALDVQETPEAALKEARSMFTNGALYSYAVINDEENKLGDERFVSLL